MIRSPKVPILLLCSIGLTQAALAGENIQAGVSLTTPTNVNAHWDKGRWNAAGNLGNSLTAGEEIGRLSIDTVGNNIVKISEKSSVLSDHFTFYKDGESHNGAFYVTASREGDSGKLTIIDRTLELSGVNAASTTIVLKNAIDMKVDPGHYTAAFDVDVYNA